MRESRAASGLAAALAVVSGLAFLSGCGGSPPAAKGGVASMPPSLILAEARVAAGAAGSAEDDQSGRTTSEAFSDVGTSSSAAGRQVITTTAGVRATVLLIGDVAYLDGNLAALTTFFRLPATTASRVANKWISVDSRSRGYASLWRELSLGMTVSSVVAELTPVGSLAKTTPRTMDGRLVVGVRGMAPAWTGDPRGTTATLYVAATGQPLPVSCQQDYRSYRVTTVFRRWGEKVQVTAPHGATPIPSPPPS
jgi:hypothetical protein